MVERGFRLRPTCGASSPYQDGQPGFMIIQRLARDRGFFMEIRGRVDLTWVRSNERNRY
jgi:hypothetical protein